MKKKHPGTKLTDDEVLIIRANLKMGVSQAVLAKRHHVSPGLISEIKRNKCHKVTAA